MLIRAELVVLHFLSDEPFNINVLELTIDEHAFDYIFKSFSKWNFGHGNHMDGVEAKRSEIHADV